MTSALDCEHVPFDGRCLPQAGIPGYWRIGTEDVIAVHTHRLVPAGKVYGQTGAFKDVIEVTEPWELSIPVAEITPRWLR
jgi:hypothetical protein